MHRETRRAVGDVVDVDGDGDGDKQRAFVRWKREKDRARASRAERERNAPLKQPALPTMRRGTAAPLFVARHERLFDADPEEDELVRMIMEKERAENEAVPMKSAFYSPVRPADAEERDCGSAEVFGHAPFRARRGAADRHKQQSGQRNDMASNQVDDHEPMAFRAQKETEDPWEQFVSGTSSDSAAASLCQKPSSPRNIFREEISLSREDPAPAASAESAPREVDGRSQHSHSQQQQHPSSTKYSNVSIPNVSYTPPMSPVAGSSRWQQAGGRPRQTASGDKNPKGSCHTRRTSEQLDLGHSPAAFPLWSVVFLVGCIVLGLSGFFVEDVLDWAGKLSSRAAAISLTKDEQKQMHARLEQLQSEIHGFRHTASEIGTHSHRVFEEVKAHLDRMRSEREKHQEAIAREMNDLRSSMLQMMGDMVEQERGLIRSRLQQMAAANAEIRDNLGDRVVRNADAHTRDKLADAVNESNVKTQANDPKAEGVGSSSESVRTATEEAAQPNAVPASTDRNATKTKSFPPSPHAGRLSRGESMMLLSWELLTLLAAMSVLGGFVGLRVRNINRRKRWFDQRRERRNLQAELARERGERIGDFDEYEDEEEGEDVSDGLSELTESAYDDDGDDDVVGADETNSEATAGDDEEEEDWDDSATESGIETVSLMRRVSEDTPASSHGQERRVRLRVSSSDAGDDDDTSVGTLRSKKAESYTFVRDDLEQSPSSRRRSPRLQQRQRRR